MKWNYVLSTLCKITKFTNEWNSLNIRGIQNPFNILMIVLSVRFYLVSCCKLILFYKEIGNYLHFDAFTL